MTVATAATTATIYRRRHITIKLIRYDSEFHRRSSLARLAIRFVAG